MLHAHEIGFSGLALGAVLAMLTACGGVEPTEPLQIPPALARYDTDPPSVAPSTFRIDCWAVPDSEQTCCLWSDLQTKCEDPS